MEVCALLEARGVSCWIAPRDVAPGAKWDEALLHAIDEGGAFLLLLSTASNDSPFVQNEVNRAFGKQKAIFTFRIEDVAPAGSLEFYLARHHWIDGFPAPLEEKVARLAAAIAGLPAPAEHRVVLRARSPRIAWRRYVGYASTFFMGALAAGLIAWPGRGPVADEQPVLHLTVPLPGGA